MIYSHAGIATHFVPSVRVDDLVESLSHSDVAPEALAEYIEQFAGEEQPFSLQTRLDDINQYFSAPTLQKVISQLENREDEWAKNTLKTILTMSPTASLVTMKMLRLGREMSFRDCLRMEYILAKNFLERVADLREGVSAKLVRKEKSANWMPAKLEDVSEEFIDSLFKGLSIPSLDFSNTVDFDDYPHQDNALPSTRRIKTLVSQNRNLKSWQEVADQHCILHHHKRGLRQRLYETMEKHVKTREQIEKTGLLAVNGLNWTD
ncbi:3-hydroxyisobutyryl-CoA hydrolase, mitochondrial [Paramicrosporidium saccamoebae]|uniref:3-hydroxyisobutyryl-CoA hydrolase n=1 Tax=Paramicrosporidium saccamoebae TaxID=1246581 RepID=A0A2H9TLJ9_9FUNG|nr:3-hydroxyisobutyryl-CoA hydrolase, mitochondrial [Paramicrosporidium saccamoebae]